MSHPSLVGPVRTRLLVEELELRSAPSDLLTGHAPGAPPPLAERPRDAVPAARVGVLDFAQHLDFGAAGRNIPTGLPPRLVSAIFADALRAADPSGGALPSPAALRHAGPAQFQALAAIFPEVHFSAVDHILSAANLAGVPRATVASVVSAVFTSNLPALPVTALGLPASGGSLVFRQTPSEGAALATTQWLLLQSVVAIKDVHSAHASASDSVSAIEATRAETAAPQSETPDGQRGGMTVQASAAATPSFVTTLTAASGQSDEQRESGQETTATQDTPSPGNVQRQFISSAGGVSCFTAESVRPGTADAGNSGQASPPGANARGSPISSNPASPAGVRSFAIGLGTPAHTVAVPVPLSSALAGTPAASGQSFAGMVVTSHVVRPLTGPGSTVLTLTASLGLTRISENTSSQPNGSRIVVASSLGAPLSAAQSLAETRVPRQSDRAASSRPNGKTSARPRAVGLGDAAGRALLVLRTQPAEVLPASVQAALTTLPQKTRRPRLEEWACATRTTLALVFTDMVDSTALGRDLGDEAMNEVRRAHFQQGRRLLERHAGCEIKTLGDAFLAAFHTADEALDFALAFVARTGHERVVLRAGIHVGPVVIEEDDVFGLTVNYAARVVHEAGETEIWLSDRARQDIDAMKAAAHARLCWTEHAQCQLKGFADDQRLWSVTPRSEPPAN